MLTSQHRVLAHVLYHKGGPRGSHTEYRKNTGTFHAVPAWYPRLRVGPPGPALARGGPALVAAGRPQEGPDERCCREGDRLAVDQAWEGKGLGAAM